MANCLMTQPLNESTSQLIDQEVFANYQGALILLKGSRGIKLEMLIEHL